ncbi:hypothetical protein B1219_05060 [Pseudomonas ogarae]|nr:hypothetical protein B1219_05060 [Pseudomonas ogarae]
MVKHHAHEDDTPLCEGRRRSAILTVSGLELTHCPVARELAPAGPRSGPQHAYRRTALSGFATAAQPSGSKLPRHRFWVVWVDAIASKLAPTFVRTAW